MHYCGDFRTTYQKDMEILQTPFIKVCVTAFFLFLLAWPFLVKGEYLWITLQILIASIGAVGLNILTGFTGQISLGQGAFLGVGAYTSAYVTAKLGLSFWVGVPAAGLVTAMAGMVFGIPSLRLKGLYLAIATLASQFILEWIFIRWEPVTGGSYGITIPRPTIAGYTFSTDRSYYYIVLFIAAAMILFAANLMRTKTGGPSWRCGTITSPPRSWESTCSSTGSCPSGSRHSMQVLREPCSDIRSSTSPRNSSISRSRSCISR